MSEENRKRKLISSIRDDPNLSSDEKRMRIQGVMSNVSIQEYVDDMNLSCPHYKDKKCSRMYFSCCKTHDCCHKCHVIKTKCDVKLPQIESVICNDCNVKQEPAESCVNCGVRFYHNYCPICKIWTSLECFHCNGCGVCRVGKPENMWHCDNCEACFSIKGRENHKCAASPLKNEKCPICTGSVHISLKASHILPCGHVVHGECWLAAAQKGAYRCFICKKSLIDMTRIWDHHRKLAKLNRIPGHVLEIYQNDVVDSPYGKFKVDERDIVNGVRIYHGTLLKTGEMASFDRQILRKFVFVNITCNDCGTRSNVEINRAGLECKNCGSFNTDRIK